MIRFLLALLLLAGCSDTGLQSVVLLDDEPVDDTEPEPEPEEEPEEDPLEEEEEEPIGDPIDDPPPEEEPEEPEEPEEEPEEPEEEPEEPEEPEEEPEDDIPPPPADDCADTSDLVYVIDRDEEALYLFDPDALSFTLLGGLDCGIWAGTPGSMSVSRDGFAYVRYSDDTVYAVDLVTLDCTETAYGTNFGHFGMGFATETASTWEDDLYVANGSQLARLDTNSWGLTTIAGMPSQSELTGNADGELWAFLPLEMPAELVHIDKNNGSLVQTHQLPGFPDPYSIDTFAFATWGGEFWLFVRSYGMGNSTDVYRVTASGDLELVWGDTGMDVVGAGVSTCAPS